MFFSWAWLLLPRMPCHGAACDQRTSPTCFPAGSDRWWYQTATRVRFGIRFFTLTWRSTWLAWQGWHQYSPFSSMVVLRRSMRYSGKIALTVPSARLGLFAYTQHAWDRCHFQAFPPISPVSVAVPALWDDVHLEVTSEVVVDRHYPIHNNFRFNMPMYALVILALQILVRRCLLL